MTDRRGFLWAFAICLAAGLACAGSCAAWGASLTCPPSPGPFGSSALSPDGRHLICAVDAAVPGKYELYAVDGVRDPWRLSPGMADDRDVIRFAISPDSQRVAFTSDKGTWTKYDLYATPLIGGAAVKVNASLPHEHDADTFIWSGDSARVIWRQGRNTTGDWALFSASPSGAGRTQLSQAGYTVDRVFTTVWGGQRVRFQAEPLGGGQSQVYVIPVAGGRIAEEMFQSSFETGTFSGWIAVK